MVWRRRSRFAAKGSGVILAQSFWLLAGGAVLAQSTTRAPLDRIADIGPAILACWHPPADARGMELTLVFSLDRRGAVLGKPRISYSKLLGDRDRQRRFVAAVLEVSPHARRSRSQVLSVALSRAGPSLCASRPRPRAAISRGEHPRFDGRGAGV
jgi:hypothetical protein